MSPKLPPEGDTPDAAEAPSTARPKEREAPADDVNVFDAQVSEMVFQGESFLMYAELPGGVQLAVRGGAHRELMARVPERGGNVSLGLHRDDAVLVAEDA